MPSTTRLVIAQLSRNKNYLQKIIYHTLLPSRQEKGTQKHERSEFGLILLLVKILKSISFHWDQYHYRFMPQNTMCPYTARNVEVNLRACGSGCWFLKCLYPFQFRVLTVNLLLTVQYDNYISSFTSHNGNVVSHLLVTARILIIF